ncbi:MAG: DegT/DnrJ/EryC1/StrS aminotransferase family protein [Treponema sp.]|nr:DegT/DnrJ/EryC1/StrS aminotransferase family protein [Treponema sp.]
MIQTLSSTIRRKEMEAVLTCMVDEKIGPGQMNARLIQTFKELTSCDGAVAFRSPAIALEYALKALALPEGSSVVISALSPYWQILTLEKNGYKPVVLDVSEDTAQFSFADAQNAVKDGARLIILTETMGILPDIKNFISLGVPVIEDVSQSALSFYPEEGTPKPAEKVQKDVPDESAALKDELPKGKRAGMYGTFSIMGMEENDIITSGGGAVLFAPLRRDWSVLKKFTDQAPATDIMPDMNAALANVELKEYVKNERVRKELFALYSRAVASSRHKTFVREDGWLSTVYSFPLVLNTGFKDVKNYAAKKGIEVRYAFESSAIALRQESLAPSCICANSLLLRCALFPLYPRLGQKDAAKIVKVLSSLP